MYPPVRTHSPHPLSLFNIIAFRCPNKIVCPNNCYIFIIHIRQGFDVPGSFCSEGWSFIPGGLKSCSDPSDAATVEAEKWLSALLKLAVDAQRCGRGAEAHRLCGAVGTEGKGRLPFPSDLPINHTPHLCGVVERWLGGVETYDPIFFLGGESL